MEEASIQLEIKGDLYLTQRRNHKHIEAWANMSKIRIFQINSKKSHNSSRDGARKLGQMPGL
jgi:hypothetical protein